MPEYDISYGNYDVTPQVSTIRVFGLDERWALKAAHDQLDSVSADGQPAAWTVIDIQQVEEEPEPERIFEGVPNGAA